MFTQAQQAALASLALAPTQARPLRQLKDLYVTLGLRYPCNTEETIFHAVTVCQSHSNSENGSDL